MIACPVALQGMLNTIVNLVDTLMIGTVGATAVAAAGLVNKFFLVFSLLVFGIVSGGGVLAAQLWGNSDLRSIQKILGLSVLPVLTGVLFLVVPTLVSPQPVMRIFTTSHDSVRLGSKYLKVVVLTYPFLAMANVYVAILRAVSRIIFPVISSCIAIVINICLNYVLVFSKLDMPAIGMSGTAVATLIVKIIEIVLILGYVYGKKLPVVCGLQDLFGWNRLSVNRSFDTSTPVITNEFMWGLGTAMYSLAHGRMGDKAIAAIAIVTTVQDILVVLLQGLSAATAVILGDELEAGHLKQAEKYAVHFFILQLTATVGVAVVLIGIHWPVIGPYNIMPEMARDVSLCILIFAAYMPAKMFNHVSVAGILGSGGDAKMCLFPDISGVWFIGVPLAFLGALVWRLPIYTVYTLVMTEEVYKTVLGYIRHRQKKWPRNLASDMGWVWQTETEQKGLSAEGFFLPYKENRVNIEKMCIKYNRRLYLNV